MSDRIREAFEAQYPADLDKPALNRNSEGRYILMQTYLSWSAFKDGYEAALKHEGENHDGY